MAGGGHSNWIVFRTNDAPLLLTDRFIVAELLLDAVPVEVLPASVQCKKISIQLNIKHRKKNRLARMIPACFMTMCLFDCANVDLMRIDRRVYSPLVGVSLTSYIGTHTHTPAESLQRSQLPAHCGRVC